MTATPRYPLPDLNTLPAPQPGAERPQATNTKDAMLDAMFSDSAPK